MGHLCSMDMVHRHPVHHQYTPITHQVMSLEIHKMASPDSQQVSMALLIWHRDRLQCRQVMLRMIHMDKATRSDTQPKFQNDKAKHGNIPGDTIEHNYCIYIFI